MSIKHRELHQRELDSLSTADEGVLSGLNAQIHRALLDASGNEVLHELVGYLLARVPSFRLFALGNRDDLKQFVDDHGLIIEALAAGDSDAAAQIMSEHVHRARVLLSDLTCE